MNSRNKICKLASLLVCCSLSMGALVGCGGKEKPVEQPIEQPQVQTSIETEPQENIEDVTPVPDEMNMDDTQTMYAKIIAENGSTFEQIFTETEGDSEKEFSRLQEEFGGREDIDFVDVETAYAQWKTDREFFSQNTENPENTDGETTDNADGETPADNTDGETPADNVDGDKVDTENGETPADNADGETPAPADGDNTDSETPADNVDGETPADDNTETPDNTDVQ